MIELLVVIAIATIGVVYTSSTGEAESSAMADKSAKDALNEAEGQGGIGILGIDVVARKMRSVVGLRQGAVSADSIAEFRAGEDHDDLDDVEWADDVAIDEEDRAAAMAEDWGDSMVFNEDADEDEVEPGLRKINHSALLRSTGVKARNMADEDYLDAVVAEAETWLRDADGELVDPEDGMQDDTLLGDVLAEIGDDVEDEDYDNAPVQSAPAAAPAMAEIDTEDAPIVDEFDPAQDQILIGYRPGEAGNGRIGIMEDPLRPGSAAVTLGGRCVAVVLGGFGKVRAHHIDLVCEDDEDDDAGYMAA
ncbi:hypothetical protein [Pseudooceanicola onchidii]|uniref:hypothetical protein n=1 Tax=Pseudooceanicola onchidii TaxID=2562279 RepID=UPI0010AAAAEB|nr:hypothetical protein [Pseudooceanicola onchidii]